MNVHRQRRGISRLDGEGCRADVEVVRLRKLPDIVGRVGLRDQPVGARCRWRLDGHGLVNTLAGVQRTVESRHRGERAAARCRRGRNKHALADVAVGGEQSLVCHVELHADRVIRQRAGRSGEAGDDQIRQRCEVGGADDGTGVVALASAAGIVFKQVVERVGRDREEQVPRPIGRVRQREIVGAIPRCSVGQRAEHVRVVKHRRVEERRSAVRVDDRDVVVPVARRQRVADVGVLPTNRDVRA